MWMKTIQPDLKSNNLSLNKAIDVAQNHPLWRLMSTFVVMHSVLLHVSNDDDEHRREVESKDTASEVDTAKQEI